MKNISRGLNFVLITDRKKCKLELKDIVIEAIEGGVDTVQLRENGLSSRELYKLAKDVQAITRKKDVRLIINDRVDIALAVDADGVHLGWLSMDIDIVRRMIGPDKFIGISTHNLKEAKRAVEGGVDYISISPIFETPYKDFFIKPLGLDKLRKIKNKINIPVIALGGINKNNVEGVLENGADGIAVISAILLSDNPRQSANNIYCKINNLNRN